MSDGISMRIDGQEKMRQALGEIPEGLEEDARRTVNAGARWGAAQAARRIAKAHRLPFKVVRDKSSKHNRVDYRLAKRAGRRGNLKNTRTHAVGSVIWVGRNPIKAAYLGDLFQSDKGAGAGGYYWKGAFTAATRSGHSSIFYRLGRGRLPIEERRVPLSEAPAIAAQINDELPAKLLSLFEREVAK